MNRRHRDVRSARSVARKPPRRVGLLINPFPGFSVRLLEGVADYVRRHGPWRYLVTHNSHRFVAQWLQRAEPDGVIAHCSSGPLRDLLIDWGGPAVSVSGNTLHEQLPTVTTHNESIGRCAARYLLDRGLRNFAFVAMPARFSRLRQRGFVRAVEQAGWSCDVFEDEPPLEESGSSSSEAMERWLAGLPRPVGLMASHDRAASELIDACAHLGLRVPDQVAIVGVDNDAIVCESSSPSLSSVDTNLPRNGHEAAALLARLMDGESPPPDPVLIEPWGVVTRQSTDMLACNDPTVASAVRFIEAHCGESIGVEDILETVSVSRRSLERRFREHLNRSPREEIGRVRLERARVLLTETDLPLSTIAARCGYAYLSHLSAAFKKESGMTPTAYRKQFRLR